METASRMDGCRVKIWARTRAICSDPAEQEEPVKTATPEFAADASAGDNSTGGLGTKFGANNIFEWCLVFRQMPPN